MLLSRSLARVQQSLRKRSLRHGLRSAQTHGVRVCFPREANTFHLPTSCSLPACATEDAGDGLGSTGACCIYIGALHGKSIVYVESNQEVTFQCPEDLDVEDPFRDLVCFAQQPVIVVARC